MKTNTIRICISIATICLCIVFLTAILIQHDINNKKISVSTNSEKILLPEKNSEDGLSASFSKTYSNIQDLKKDSYAIILGDVINSDKNIRYNDHVDIAISEVKVIDCFSDNISSDDVISIEETGVRDDKGDISIDSVPLLRKDMRVLLFLTEPSNVVQGNKLGYGIVGSYQGKFFVDENNIAYQSAYFSDHAQPIPEIELTTNLSDLSL